MEGIDYNLRGLNTFNLFKRVVWSCVTNQGENEESNGKSEVNLPLLKGLLNEIYSEIYLEDFLQKMQKDNDGYNHEDIHSFEGYNDYRPINDHPDINKQVQQIVLINP